MNESESKTPGRFARRLRVAAVAGFAFYLAVELSARGLRFPKKAVAQVLLAPLFPLIPLIGGGFDVDSFGLAGAVFRGGLFSGWVVLAAFLFHRSRESRAIGWRAMLGVLIAWSGVTIAGFGVLRILVEASFRDP